MKNVLSRLVLALATGFTLSGTGLVAATINGLVGQSATLNASAGGTAPFAYQWYKGGVAIANATSASYVISQLSLTDAGDYTVTMSNVAGAASSTATTLTVSAPVSVPSITTQPASLGVTAGQSASFSVVASGGVLSYQWYKAGVAISGATSATYTIASTVTTDAASYTVAVTNSVGSVLSAGASLTVNAAATKPNITSSPVSQTVNAGQSVSFTVKATSTGTLTYIWKKDGKSIANSNTATYTIAAATLADAGSYTAVVSSSGGVSGSSAATLTVTAPAAPVVTTQPISLSINTGKPASFSVAVTSPVAVSYQWNKNGTPIAGATSATYAIAATSATDAGSYSVTVSNSGGSTVSSSASLTVNATPTYNRVTTLSVNTVIDASNSSAIVGFATDGANTRRFLVRGAGPALANYGVTNVLAQPKLEVHTNVNGVDTLVGSNTQWSTETLANEAFIESGAFPFATGSNDTALVITVPAGTYTIVLTGLNGSTGNALVELYELP